MGTDRTLSLYHLDYYIFYWFYKKTLRYEIIKKIKIICKVKIGLIFTILIGNHAKLQLTMTILDNKLAFIACDTFII